MERRFPAALVSAVVLHAALLGLSAWPADGGGVVPLASNTKEVEVSLLVQDGPPSPVVTDSASGQAHSREAAHQAPVAHRASASSAASVSVVAETEGAVAEASPGEPDAVGAVAEATPRRHIDLGLDGSIVARTLRQTEQHETEAQRRARHRPGLVFDGWSEGVVSKVAHTTAPSEGSALLTIEWSADGRLASIRSSAESSNADGWRKLAAALQKQLAQRPQPSSKGLRLTYLVKSEIVKPGQKSNLPESRNVNFQTFRDDQLPPANVLMLGVSADTSPASQRVVRVMLASSQAL